MPCSRITAGWGCLRRRGAAPRALLGSGTSPASVAGAGPRALWAERRASAGLAGLPNGPGKRLPRLSYRGNRSQLEHPGHHRTPRGGGSMATSRTKEHVTYVDGTVLYNHIVQENFIMIIDARNRTDFLGKTLRQRLSLCSHCLHG